MTALAEPPVQGRVFVCVGCRNESTVETLVGPLPTLCDDCHPDAEYRRRHRGLSRARAQGRKAKLAELEQRIRELEELLKLESGGSDRALSCGEPGRDALARAVLRLTRRGDVVGKEPTIDALLTVSAIARAWAARLGLKETT
jgi:hypothetical protein